MAIRFEFDSVNKILLFRIEGQMTIDLLARAFDELGRYRVATDARACIADLLLVTERRESGDFVRYLASREPVMPTRPRFIVVDSAVGYGLARMFQIVRADRGHVLHIERTLGVALAALGVEFPQFEPLE